MLTTYKIRIYPTAKQAESIDTWFVLMAELYNAALQERRDAWILNRISINYPDQNRQLTDIKKIRPEYKQINSHALQNVLQRLDKAFKAFYRRAQSGAGTKAGFPKFKASKFFDSFSVPNTRYSIDNDRKKLYLSRLGEIKLKLKETEKQRIEGELKTLTIKRDGRGKFWATIAAEVEFEKLPHSEKEIGLDLGYRYAICTSDGKKIENPNLLQKLERKLRIAQRRVTRRKKGSNGRLEAIKILRGIHEKIRNARNTFQHQKTAEIISEYGFIAAEDLGIAKMVENNEVPKRNKSLLDVAPSGIVEKLEYKSKRTGRIFRKVKPSKHNKTAQTCVCGATLAKDIQKDTVKCLSCGKIEDRGIMSANVILQKAKTTS